MIRGHITFTCDNCNNTFRALVIEYNASTFSVPMPCPKCNSQHTYILSEMTVTSIKRYGKKWTKKKVCKTPNKHLYKEGYSLNLWIINAQTTL